MRSIVFDNIGPVSCLQFTVTGLLCQRVKLDLHFQRHANRINERFI